MNPDAVFHALAHTTRRAVLAQLSRGPAPVSVLAAAHPMALPTFVQHLRVLERAGVVRSRKQGRVRTYALAPAPLKEAEAWLVEQRSAWESLFDRFDAFVTQPEKE